MYSSIYSYESERCLILYCGVNRRKKFKVDKHWTSWNYIRSMKQFYNRHNTNFRNYLFFPNFLTYAFFVRCTTTSDTQPPPTRPKFVRFVYIPPAALRRILWMTPNCVSSNKHRKSAQIAQSIHIDEQIYSVT